MALCARKAMCHHLIAFFEVINGLRKSCPPFQRPDCRWGWPSEPKACYFCSPHFSNGSPLALPPPHTYDCQAVLGVNAPLMTDCCNSAGPAGHGMASNLSFFIARPSRAGSLMPDGGDQVWCVGPCHIAVFQDDTEGTSVTSRNHFIKDG